MFRQYKIRNYSFLLMGAVIALSIIGILIIGSAQNSSQIRQIYGLVIGGGLMLILSLIDYTWILHFRYILYVIGCLFLLAVLFFGVRVAGATRWLNIGIQFQPSDLMKLILILFFAGFFQKYEDKVSSPPVILLSLAILAVPMYLIYQEPDLSTTIVTALVFCAIIFSAGLSFRFIIGVLVVIIPLAAIFLSIVVRPDQTLIKSYQRNRIMSFLKPEEFPEDAFQQQNSIIAIGSGQLYGKGLNNNMVSSVKNGNFIAEPQTDFIFAVAGEELGFVGCVAIVLLELLIGVLCIRIGMQARQKAGALIGMGMGSLVITQSGLNIGVTTGLMPNTGITLPFVSYGVTSLLTFCMGIGICLNVGLQPKSRRVSNKAGDLSTKSLWKQDIRVPRNYDPEAHGRSGNLI